MRWGIFWFGLAVAISAAQPMAAQEPKAAPLPLRQPVRDKNFFLFRALEISHAATALRQDRALTDLSDRYRARLAEAVATCGEAAGCYLRAVKLRAEEVGAGRDALRSLYKTDPAVRAAVDGPLRASGTLVKLDQGDGADLIGRAWEAAAAGINRIFAVYGEGMAPRFKEIDSASYDLQSEAFGKLVRVAVEAALSAPVRQGMLFDGPADMALSLLAINSREDAGRFEPLDRGGNAAAIVKIRQIDWSHFPYSAILVPGSGPEDAQTRLSPMGKLRLELAVQRYRAHLAPFIIVSGGQVHPAHTRFNEAVEMKHTLLEYYHVPESAIIVEPHARHTTTNIRNAVRLMFRYGMPPRKPGLIVTDEYQTRKIMNPGFGQRNLEETGVLPYSSLTLVSGNAIAFLPAMEGLQVGGDDPLDP